MCEALIAATFSFFSAMRFDIRALKIWTVSFKREKKVSGRTHTPPSALSDVPAGES